MKTFVWFLIIIAINALVSSIIASVIAYWTSNTFISCFVLLVFAMLIIRGVSDMWREAKDMV